MKIKEKLKDLLKRYKKITTYKYAYNTAGDLKKSSPAVIVYYLLYEEQHGYSIMKFEFKRKSMSIKEWRKFMEKESDEVFVGKVLPAINTKYGSAWIFKDLILWSVKSDIRKPENTDQFEDGNKTTKKRKK